MKPRVAIILIAIFAFGCTGTKNISCFDKNDSSSNLIKIARKKAKEHNPFFMHGTDSILVPKILRVSLDTIENKYILHGRDNNGARYCLLLDLKWEVDSFIVTLPQIH